MSQEKSVCFVKKEGVGNHPLDCPAWTDTGHLINNPQTAYSDLRKEGKMARPRKITILPWTPRKRLTIGLYEAIERGLISAKSWVAVEFASDVFALGTNPAEALLSLFRNLNDIDQEARLARHRIIRRKRPTEADDRRLIRKRGCVLRCNRPVRP